MFELRGQDLTARKCGQNSSEHNRGLKTNDFRRQILFTCLASEKKMQSNVMDSMSILIPFSHTMHAGSCSVLPRTSRRDISFLQPIVDKSCLVRSISDLSQLT